MPFYFASDISNPWRNAPDGATVVERGFSLNYKNALAAAGAAAAGFLINDYLVLAPIPTSGFVLSEYYIDAQAMDTSTGITLDLGDNQVLSGAVTGNTGTSSQTTPVLAGTSFTLTAAASTASFTSTNGLLMVGGCMISYGALSGSTFTTCYAAQQGFVIPPGSVIQQAGNTAAYNAVAVIGQSSAEGYLFNMGNATGTTFTAATVVSQALPAGYPSSFNTGFGVTPPIATPYNLGPMFFMIRIHASATTNPTYTTAGIKGWHRGHYKGF